MLKGLSNAEVNERKSRGLINKAVKSKTKTIGEIFIENIFSLFNFIIIGIIAGVIFFYLRTSDIRLLLDSFGILTIAVINTAIAITQEIKSKRALDKVNLLLKRNVTVLREGKETEIGTEEIVKDDVIFISRGDQIVVDGKVAESNYLEIDESLLTGESVPISKSAGSDVLSGSFCVSGSGYYIAEKIGSESYAESVTGLAKKYKFILTPLQRKINAILKVLFVSALVLSLLKIITGPGNESETNFVRDIATILISLVPQGLVLTASVTYALGVYRISKIGAIIQKLNAIESFSNVSVVCMDKTGTLTQNKLSVHKITNLSGITDDELKQLLGTYSHLSTEKNATNRALDIFSHNDNTEKLEEMPFSSSIKMSMVKFSDGIIYILGAYDILLEKTDEATRNIFSESYEKENLGLYRNLIFGKVESGNTIEELKDKLNEIKITPYCIISIADTIRDDVFDALKLFEKNGIRFKILSGDSTQSIKAIMEKIGWKVKPEELITGDELESLSESDFERAINEKLVFARLIPEHKLRIIKAFRKQKIYTAMIGDGVNDLPAIKESDMGIAMEEGSSITKEVADIVLLKNKFSLLPKIFDEGNRIVNSVKLISKLFLTKNFMVILLTILSFFSLEYPLTPRRVSLLNIFAIGFPALILTMRNKNVSKTINFLSEVFSYVIVASLVIVAGGYSGYYLTGNSDMAMLSVMIFIAVASFIVVSRYAEENRKVYFVYGFGLLMIYVFFTATNFDFILFRVVKIFYEIDVIQGFAWIYISVISVLGYLILYTFARISRRD